VLTHTRKAAVEDDPLDAISGTLGQVGCADTGLVLARGPHGATLYARGRDIEEIEHAVLFNKDTCRWNILWEAADVQRSDTRKKIIATLFAAKRAMGPKDIAAASALSVEVVKKRIADMVADGEVNQLGRAQYAHLDLPPA
jgi:hypothetical protein